MDHRSDQCPRCASSDIDASLRCRGCGTQLARSGGRQLRSATSRARCHECNQPVDVGDLHCPTCAALQVQQCPRCRRNWRIDEQFCRSCGADVPRLLGEADEAERRSQATIDRQAGWLMPIAALTILVAVLLLGVVSNLALLPIGGIVYDGLTLAGSAAVISYKPVVALLIGYVIVRLIGAVDQLVHKRVYRAFGPAWRLAISRVPRWARAVTIIFVVGLAYSIGTVLGTPPAVLGLACFIWPGCLVESLLPDDRLRCLRMVNASPDAPVIATIVTGLAGPFVTLRAFLPAPRVEENARLAA